MGLRSIILYLSSTLTSIYIKVALSIVLLTKYNTQSYYAQFQSLFSLFLSSQHYWSLNNTILRINNAHF